MSLSMNTATLSANSRRKPSETGSVRRIAAALARPINELSVTEKIYCIVAGLFIVTAVLLVMSILTVRLQTEYRHLQAASAEAASNVGRVNGLIYAIVM